jgi:hypothetical protein
VLISEICGEHFCLWRFSKIKLTFLLLALQSTAMRYFLLCCCFLFFAIQLSSAADNYPVGARSGGVANASVTFSDVWSTYHNQAGLAYLKNITAGTYFENRFLVSQLGLRSIALAIPTTKSGVFGVSGTFFGYEQYSEKKGGLAYAKMFGEKVSAGVQLDYLSTFINDELYGSRNTFAVEAGILTEPLKNFKVGAHIFNPNRAKLASYGDERVPVIMRIGASYKFSEKVLLSSEMEKDIDYKNIFKAAFEYHPVDIFYLRGGIASNPSLSCFGFGLKLKEFLVDMSAQYHEVLGFTPQFSLGYEFK